jgi:RimJ/RimL family protein N-acetyltransferase
MALRTALHTTPFDASHLQGLQAVEGRAVSMCALTVWDGEEPLCCFGITSPWPGLGVAWCAERDAEAMALHGRRVGLLIARMWRQWLVEGHYRRIESRAPRSHRAAQRLLDWLGFEFVAAKRLYGPDNITVFEYVYFPKE